MDNSSKVNKAVIIKKMALSFDFDFDLGKKVLFPKGYNQNQIDCINALVSEMNAQNVSLINQAAYIIASAFHETYDYTKELRFGAMKELGGDVYLKYKPYYPYFGRGFCHLTWEANYIKEGRRLKMNLHDNPDLALKLDISANIIVNGMLTGSFTGAKLSTYLTANKTDYPNARRTINGMDCAAQIAGYASEFAKCITFK